MLCRPPYLILSYLFRWLLFLVEPFFISLYKPVRLWNILAYCQVFIVTWLLATMIASFFRPLPKYGRVRLRWCRTPRGYYIHQYGSSLRKLCICRLHTQFKTQALLRAPPISIHTFNSPTQHIPTYLPAQLHSDSHTLIIDNGCSASITNSMEDFISPPWQVRANIEGYSRSTSATHVGTVRWKIEDDLGRTHDILLPNTYYSPHSKHRLLCPQHWAQTAKDNTLHPNGTWCATYADYVVLYWNQQQYRRTVKLLPHTNVGVICTAPGIQQYAHTCSLLEIKLGIITMPATIDLGLDDAHSTHGVEMVHNLCRAKNTVEHNLCCAQCYSTYVTNHDIAQRKLCCAQHNPSYTTTTSDIAQHNLCRDLNECSNSTLPTIQVVTDSEGETEPAETSNVTHEESQQESPNNQPCIFKIDEVLGNGEPLPEDLHPEYSLAQQELLHWHYRLNHLSFTRIQERLNNGFYWHV